jgi:aminopeptidase N
MLYQGSYADTSKAGPGFIRYLAHEISHLWWRGADTTDWQDWLNESFAEMSALMILRKEFGEQEFRDRLARYRNAATGTPPLRGLDRDDEDAYTVLYQKGPVLLADLEQTIGAEAFLRFLRARLAEEANTTEECLDTLARVVSAEASDQLDAALRRH